MKKLLLIFIFIFCLSQNLKSQTHGFNSFGIINHSVGLTNLTNFKILKNPANLQKIPNNIAFSVSPSKFGLTQLNSALILYSKQIDSNFFSAVNCYDSGFELYNEFSSSLNFAYKTSKITIGSRIEYNLLSVKNYSNDSYLNFDVGCNLPVNEIINFAFVFTNINHASYKTDNSTINQTLMIGTGIKLQDNLYFDGDFVINLNHNSGLALSIMDKLNENLSFSISYLTNPLCIEAGIKTEFAEWDISINSNYNLLIGMSNFIEIGYRFK